MLISLSSVLSGMFFPSRAWTYLKRPSAMLPLSTLVTNMPQSPGKQGSFTPSAMSNPSAFKSISSCQNSTHRSLPRWEKKHHKTQLSEALSLEMDMYEELYLPLPATADISVIVAPGLLPGPLPSMGFVSTTMRYRSGITHLGWCAS